jgi:SNF family Na+-dependent transporter
MPGRRRRGSVHTASARNSRIAADGAASCYRRHPGAAIRTEPAKGPRNPSAKRMSDRQRWATKTGLILALAGNAIGLGNFLRFPVQAAGNGGGAFMIPYFFALLAIGLPMMWLECTIGRLGGKYGHGHAAGMIAVLWKHPAAKYVGALGLFIPFTIVLYYTYITSWCLSFSVFSVLGSYDGLTTREEMGAFLSAFQGVSPNAHFGSVATAYAAWFVTLGLTLAVLLGGVARGIERLAKTAIPLLFALGVVLVIRVLMLGTPDAARPEWNVWNGLGFVWNPDLSRLGDPKVWIAAAGQIFFTLSIGWGIVHTYVSYLRQDDDVVLTGVSTLGVNEFAEVVLGGTIAITAAVAFFGIQGTTEIAAGGAFDLGFQAMPAIFQRLPAGNLIGALWFLLLFFAGITSAVAMGQPMVALFQENWDVGRRGAVAILGGLMFVLTQPVIFFHRHGFLDELDFWVGSVALVVFALLEVIFFGWIFGIDRGWNELRRGATFEPPVFFKFVTRYVTPVFLGTILLWWAVTDLPAKFSLDGVAPEARPIVLSARMFILALLFGVFALVRRASERWSPADGGNPS